MKYPSKKEILSYKQIITKREIETIKIWKRKHWLPIEPKTAKNSTKLACFNILLHNICKIHDLPIPNLEFTSKSRGFYLDIENGTIALGLPFSLVTALHETAHHIYPEGEELFACVWSVQLFKKAFPKAYANLIWDGHILTRQKNEKTKNKKTETSGRTNTSIIQSVAKTTMYTLQPFGTIRTNFLQQL